MMAKAAPTIDKRLAGIQIALFELVWPAFLWISRIKLKSGNKSCRVYVLTNKDFNIDEWSDCDHLLREIFDEALKRSGISYEIDHGKALSKSVDYEDLMSDAIFKKIAAEVAPWRLKAGR